MNDSPPSNTLDIAGAHWHFAAHCFNATWALIDKPHRTADDGEAMILCAAASLWHWTQRADCTSQNLSIGHWQLARVYSLVGQGENAMRHAQRSIDLAAGCSSFFRGFAHEAAARAALILRDRPTCLTHLQQARACLDEVATAADHTLLEQDIVDVETNLPGV